MKNHPSFLVAHPTGFISLCLMLAILFFCRPATGIAAPLRVGVASMVTPVSTVRYYQQIVDYLSDKLGMEAAMVHRTTYDEIDRLLKQRQVDVAFICSAPYVVNKDAFGVELLVAPVVDGKTTYHSNIIVHRDSSITEMKDLAGKRFAFVDPKSNSGRLYPFYLLARQGQTPDTFFSRYFYSYSHNKSVEMVAKKKADGASVDSIVYAYMLAENSPYAKQTKVIHQSPEFGIPPIVVHPSLPLFLKTKIRDVFLGMHLDPQGKKILANMRIERFTPISDAQYDLIREMRDFLGAKSKTGDKRAAAAVSSPDQKRVYQFGVIPRDNPRLAYEKYQPLLDYLAAETGLRIDLLLKNTYQETVKSVGTGEMDFALLGPLTYLDAYSSYGTPPVVKSKTAEGEPSYTSVIVTGPNSDLKTIEDVNAKTMAFASIWSTSGNLIPRYLLAWDGIHLDKLAEYKNFNYHDTVVKKVLSGEYAAGGIRLSVARKYQQLGLRVLATSAPIPTGPIVVSPETPYAVVKKVQKALLAIEASELGKKTLKLLDPDLQGGFAPASDAEYGGIRKMINEVPTGCGIGCHPKTTF